MDAISVFKEQIGNRLKPIILSYDVYKDKFQTYPYHHVLDDDFEQKFAEILFDSIVFYAFEKDEIEKDYSRGRLTNLRKAARSAYELRIPKTEKTTDGLMGELALDSFIKCFFDKVELLYSRVKYLERIPQSKENPERKGHEVKGYDGLVFSEEDGNKYMWVGQVKTGGWAYCFDGIKEDINKSVLSYYFSSAMVILADIMRAANGCSSTLQKIIDDINDILLDFPFSGSERDAKIIDYFISEKIIIRIPCMIIAEENNYEDKTKLLCCIKQRCKEAFKDFVPINQSGLNTEIALMIFPVRDIDKLRKNFLEVRKPDGKQSGTN